MKRSPLLAAAALVAAGTVSALFLFDRLDSSLDPAADSEAETTEAALIQLTGVDGELVALIEGPADATALGHTLSAVRALPGVAATEVLHSTQESGTSRPSPISPRRQSSCWRTGPLLADGGL